MYYTDPPQGKMTILGMLQTPIMKLVCSSFELSTVQNRAHCQILIEVPQLKLQLRQFVVFYYSKCSAFATALPAAVEFTVFQPGWLVVQYLAVSYVLNWTEFKT